MERLDFFGDWIGRGWITSPGGPCKVFQISCNVSDLRFCKMLVKQFKGSEDKDNSRFLKYSQEDQEGQVHQCLLLDQQAPLRNTSMSAKLHFK